MNVLCSASKGKHTVYLFDKAVRMKVAATNTIQLTNAHEFRDLETHYITAAAAL